MVESKQYLIVSSAIFLGVSLIVFILVNVSQEIFKFMEINMPFPLYACITAIMFGWMISGLYSGICIFIKLIKDKSIVLKVLCGVLFPFVFIFVVYVGIFGLIPYYIMNFNKYRKNDIK